MSVAYMGARIAGLVDRFGDGGTLTFSRESTLHVDDSGGLAPLVNATVAAGGSTIVLDQAEKLRGELVSGSTFTIDGDGTTYTTTADAKATKAGLLSVSFTPVLAAEATENAAVTLVSTSTSFSLLRMRDELISMLTGTEKFEGDKRRYHVASREASPTAPEVGDRVTDGANVERVVHVAPLNPGSDVFAWTVIVGEAA